MKYLPLAWRKLFVDDIMMVGDSTPVRWPSPPPTVGDNLTSSGTYRAAGLLYLLVAHGVVVVVGSCSGKDQMRVVVCGAKVSNR